ncbi:MAG: sigma-70 family RNA polymerase sigma factor [Deltaproteobacteria bacterium]|nr:MAG: sigma-70 family RNA polymerase sigma factor [Deltaproteobacteria bacterium]
MVLMLFAMVTAPTDAELVERFKKGDRHAFDVLVQRYQDRVYSLSYRWMGDEQLALDLSQDVFIALYRSLGRFRGEAKLSTWVYRVVLNHARNKRQYRRRRHLDHHEPLEGERAVSDERSPKRQFASEGPPPDAGMERQDAVDAVQRALEELPADQREIIVLRDIEDLSYEEIAELLGVPRGTVKSRLHRARLQLGRVLVRSTSVEDVL